MATKSKIVPLLNRVLVQRLEAPKKTAAGLYLPGAEKSREAVVLATGPGATTGTGEIIPMTLKEGDRVILPDYGGTEMVFGDNERSMLFKEDDILAKVE